MATLRVEIQRNDHIADFPAVFVEVAQAHMTTVVNVVQGRVQANSPVDLGIFRGSIANSVQAAGLVVTGSVFSQDNPIKVEAIERGRRAGARWSPVGVITAWVARVIRSPVAQLRRVAYLVGRKIATRGIPARRPFERAFTETEAQVNRILGVDLPNALAKRL